MLEELFGVLRSCNEQGVEFAEQGTVTIPLFRKGNIDRTVA
jgi:hypothetical protein